MEETTLTMAQQIAQVASAFEQQRTGHASVRQPSGFTQRLTALVVTLHGALSPAERAISQAPMGRGAGSGVSADSYSRTPRTRCGTKSEKQDPGGGHTVRPASDYARLIGLRFEILS